MLLNPAKNGWLLLLAEQRYWIQFTTLGSIVPESLLQPGHAGAADRELDAAAQHRSVAVAAGWFHPGHLVEAEDKRPMHTDEFGCREGRLETGNGLLPQVLFAVAGQRHVVIVGFGVFKLLQGDDRDLGAIAHHQPG